MGSTYAPTLGEHTVGEGGFQKQVVSVRKSAAQFGFGTCERSGRDKMFLSVGHSKEKYGAGPHTRPLLVTEHPEPFCGQP